MSDLMNAYFGPLDKSFCVYFLIISVIFFIGFIILFLNEVIFIVANIKRLNFRMITSGIILLFDIFLAYFVNRLLYTMCTKSLL